MAHKKYVSFFSKINFPIENLDNNSKIIEWSNQNKFLLHRRKKKQEIVLFCVCSIVIVSIFTFYLEGDQFTIREKKVDIKFDMSAATSLRIWQLGSFERHQQQFCHSGKKIICWHYQHTNDSASAMSHLLFILIKNKQ